jgi:hypothetical protein
MRLPRTTVLVLAAALAVAGISLWTLLFGCTATRVELKEPGEPARGEECVNEFVPWLLLPLVPPALAVAGVLAGRPWMAWSGAALQALALPNYFYMGLGWWMAGAAVLLLAAVAWWHRDHRFRARAAAAAATRPPARGSRIAVFATAGVLGGLALALGLAQLPGLWDPCNTWGASGGGTATQSPGGPCPTRSYSRHTQLESAAILAFIFGVPAGLCAVAAWAAARRHGTALLVAGATLAFQGIPLYFMGVLVLLLTWPVAALWIGTGVEMRRQRQAEGPGPRSLPGPSP